MSGRVGMLRSPRLTRAAALTLGTLALGAASAPPALAMAAGDGAPQRQPEARSSTAPRVLTGSPVLAVTGQQDDPARFATFGIGKPPFTDDTGVLQVLIAPEPGADFPTDVTPDLSGATAVVTETPRGGGASTDTPCTTDAEGVCLFDGTGDEFIVSAGNDYVVTQTSRPTAGQTLVPFGPDATVYATTDDPNSSGPFVVSGQDAEPVPDQGPGTAADPAPGPAPDATTDPAPGTDDAPPAPEDGGPTAPPATEEPTTPGPTGTPADTPPDTPVETPVETPAETSGEAPTDTPLPGAPLALAAEVTVDPSTGSPVPVNRVVFQDPSAYRTVAVSVTDPSGPVAGATFDLCPLPGGSCTPGDLVTATSDASGTATFAGLYLPGTYPVTQTSAPGGRTFTTGPQPFVLAAATSAAQTTSPGILAVVDGAALAAPVPAPTAGAPTSPTGGVPTSRTTVTTAAPVLARTGADVLPLAAVGAGLLVAGVAAASGARRRAC